MAAKPCDAGHIKSDFTRRSVKLQMSYICKHCGRTLTPLGYQVTPEFRPSRSK